MQMEPEGNSYMSGLSARKQQEVGLLVLGVFGGY